MRSRNATHEFAHRVRNEHSLAALLAHLIRRLPRHLRIAYERVARLLVRESAIRTALVADLRECASDECGKENDCKREEAVDMYKNNNSHLSAIVVGRVLQSSAISCVHLFSPRHQFPLRT